MSRWVRPWSVMLVLTLAYVGMTLARYDGDPMAFALVGTRFGSGDPQGTWGYDGQFAYFIARDPLGGWSHCDVPAYRYQRILYPMLAWGLALGQPALVPWTLILVNVAALVGGTYITERLLMTRRVNPWYALAYGGYGGLVAGVRLDLTEPLAYGLVQAGLWAWEARKRRWLAGPLLTLAALTRETSLIVAGGLVLALLLARRWRAAVRLGLVVGVPFVVWQGVLWAWLGRPGVGAGGALATPFEWVPFGGMWRVVAHMFSPIPAAAMSRLAAVVIINTCLFVLPSLWALVVSARDVARGHRHPWVVILGVQAVVLPFLPFSTWREPLAMARLGTGLVAATLLYGARRHSRRVLRFSFFWLATLALLVDERTLPI